MARGWSWECLDFEHSSVKDCIEFAQSESKLQREKDIEVVANHVGGFTFDEIRKDILSAGVETPQWQHKPDCPTPYSLDIRGLAIRTWYGSTTAEDSIKWISCPGCGTPKPEVKR